MQDHIFCTKVYRETPKEKEIKLLTSKLPHGYEHTSKDSKLLDTLPTFITEMDIDWDMVTDYVMSQIQPTYMEWVEIGKVFDDTLSDFLHTKL